MAERESLLLDRILGFSKLTTADGVNAFSLEGTLDSTFHFQSAIAIFPVSPDCKKLGVLQTYTPSPEGVLAVYSKVRKLKLPEEDQLQPNEQERVFYETRSAVFGLPSIMVMFGTVDGKNGEVALLYLNAGESPQDALSQLQAAAQYEISRFN